MYDAKSEPNEFVADSPQEAVSRACTFYGSEEAALKIVHVREGEVSGLGHRAVVVAVPKELKNRPRQDSGDGDRGRGRGRRDSERGRSDSSSRGRPGGRSDGPPSGRSGGRPEERPSGRSSGRPEERPSLAAEDAPAGESKGTAKGELGPIGEFLLGTLERMGLGNFTISLNKEGDFAIFRIEGDAASRLARDGRAADALQLLANQAEMRRSEDPTRIVVDVEGETEKREDYLLRLSDRAAERAIEAKRSVALDPMNGRDRRIVHMAVREIEDVATMSIGEGQYRQVVIVPEGSPDYAKAVESSDQVRD
ncbi:MAG: R3H domain-containing nucleic acid-binding protein [Myxococcota bacterium]